MCGVDATSCVYIDAVTWMIFNDKTIVFSFFLKTDGVHTRMCFYQSIFLPQRSSCHTDFNIHLARFKITNLRISKITFGSFQRCHSGSFLWCHSRAFQPCHHRLQLCKKSCGKAYVFFPPQIGGRGKFGGFPPNAQWKKIVGNPHKNTKYFFEGENH